MRFTATTTYKRYVFGVEWDENEDVGDALRDLATVVNDVAERCPDCYTRPPEMHVDGCPLKGAVRLADTGD